MEDASVIAQLWMAEDGLDVSARHQEMSKAHARTGKLLLQIDISVGIS